MLLKKIYKKHNNNFVTCSDKKRVKENKTERERARERDASTVYLDKSVCYSNPSPPQPSSTMPHLLPAASLQSHSVAGKQSSPSPEKFDSHSCFLLVSV